MPPDTVHPEFASFPPDQWRHAGRGWAGHEPFIHPLSIAAWRGHFLGYFPVSRPWSCLEGLRITPEDWQAAWPTVLDGLDGNWTSLKTDRSGDIAAGTLSFGGREIDVVAKRPRRTRPAQWAVDLVRPARARRAWSKTWKLLVRGLPTEIPLLVMEKRRGPLVLQSVVLFERIPGPTLFHIRLDSLSDAPRRDLLARVGDTIRRTEALGFSLRDAKTTNWIAFDDGGRLLPVMLDCDGIRPFPHAGAGLERFLRALVRHPHFHPDDTAAVCGGYAASSPSPPRWLAELRQRYSIPSDNPARWNAPSVATGRAEAPPG